MNKKGITISLAISMALGLCLLCVLNFGGERAPEAPGDSKAAVQDKTADQGKATDADETASDTGDNASDAGEGAARSDAGGIYEELGAVLVEYADVPHDGFVVRVKDDLSDDTLKTIQDGLDSGVLEEVAFADNAYSVSDLEYIKENISEEDLEYIEPDFEVVLAEDAELQSVLEPNDTYYRQYQYNLPGVNVNYAWGRGIDGQDLDDTVDVGGNGNSTDEDIVIAVIDSGLKQGHKDIDWTRVVGGINVSGSGGTSIDDTQSHGTAVAGMLVARRDNALAMSGMLERVKLMPIRAFFGETASAKNIVSGIEYAVEQKNLYEDTKGASGYNVAVINLSIRSLAASKTIKDACTKAMNNGILVVCAAGNYDSNITGDVRNAASYPAQYTLGVGSTNQAKGVSEFSRILSANNGEGYENKVWVTAPGERVLALHHYSLTSSKLRNGTSFACTHVTALGAICKSIKNDMSQEEFRELLKITATRMTGSQGNINGQDIEYGWGIVNFKTTIDYLLDSQFGDREGTGKLHINLESDSGTEIKDPVVSLYRIETAQDGKEKKTQIYMDSDGSWTVNKGESYEYVVGSANHNKAVGRSIQFNDFQTLNVTLFGDKTAQLEGTTNPDANAVVKAPPAAVKGLKTVGNAKKRSLYVAFSKVNGASDYIIAWKQRSASTWKTMRTGGQRSATVNKLKAGGLYEVRVRAYRSSDKSYGKWTGIQRRYIKSVKIKYTVGKKKVKIKWKKDKKATGYKIYYSRNQNMKNARVITLKGAGKTSRTIRKLARGKVYYMEVRPYKTVGGKTYTGISGKTRLKVR